MSSEINYKEEIDKAQKDNDPIKSGNIQTTLDIFDGFTEVELKATLCIATLFELCRTGYYVPEDNEEIDPDLAYVKGLKNVGIRLNNIEDLIDVALQEYYIENVKSDVTEASRFADKLIQKVLFSSIFYGYIDIDNMKNKNEVDEDNPVEKVIKRKVNGKDLTDQELSKGRYVFIAEEEFYSAVSAELIPKTNRIKLYSQGNIKFKYASIDEDKGALDIILEYKASNEDDKVDINEDKELNGLEKDIYELINDIKEYKISIPLYRIGEYLFNVEYNMDISVEEKENSIRTIISTYLTPYMMEDLDSFINKFDTLIENINGYLE